MILVTVATGFVGSDLFLRLSTQNGDATEGSVRRLAGFDTAASNTIWVGNLSRQTNLSIALQEKDPKITFLFVGAGAAKSELEEATVRHGLKKMRFVSL